jgi:hypothetical protein
MTQSDDDFVEQLRNSNPAVLKVGAYLERVADDGYTVTVHPVRIRPTFEQRFAYKDDGDFTIAFRGEVRHRQLHFTSADDYPFPYVNADDCKKIDDAHPKPYGYFQVNADMTVAAFVPHSTAKYWRREPVEVRPGEIVEIYQCPIEHVRFIKL